MKLDGIIGGDGANSRAAEAMDSGKYKFSIALQEHIKISDEKMMFYE